MALVDKTKFHVNMDWESPYFLTKNKGQIFLAACKDYESSVDKYGTVTVIFTPKTAFLFIYDRDGEDETFYDGDAIKSWLKSNFDSSFPEMYEEYTPLVGSSDVDEAMLEKYGLSEFAEDIMNRIEDLEYYGREIEQTL